VEAVLLTPPSEERRKGFADRQWGVPKDEPAAKSYRTPQQRDRDRILYCSAFQRLAYVTQVTAPESGHTLHNRLSHSLKVAQVGRRNAERLQSLVLDGEIEGLAARLVDAVDPDGVEAACLAHDLGHPPFGHIAEWVLNRIANKHLPDGFEGNAQSFRIVTRLAVQDHVSQGLDLTRGTLDGILKYPWRHLKSDPAAAGKREHKWGYYADDAEAYGFARGGWPEETDDALPERSFQAHLMDWADDLTYAVHDMDDFFRAGLIPLDRLSEKGSTELRRFKDLLLDAQQANWEAFPGYDPDVIVEAAREAISLHGIDEPYRHVRNSRAAMRAFGSELITRYLQAFSVEDADEEPRMVALRIDEQRRCEVEALKMLVTVYVVRHPGLAVVQHGQKRLIEDLFGWYFDASDPDKTKGDRRLLPPGAKERIEAADDTGSARARVVVDLIAGMTESSAIQLHRRLSGGWTAPTLDATALMG
jgi:dGTPase